VDKKRPADWPKDVPVLQPSMSNGNNDVVSNGKGELTGKSWVKIAPIDLFPDNSGKVIKYGDTQIAIFNSHDKTQWYATQNMCPHKRAFVLADGILGDDENGVVKVSCPMHKKNFSLESGECLSGDAELKLMTFDLKIEDDSVWLHLAPTHQLDNLLGTRKLMITKNDNKKTRVNKDEIIVGCESVGCGDKKLDW